jgi:hypothetical protein
LGVAFGVVVELDLMAIEVDLKRRFGDIDSDVGGGSHFLKRCLLFHRAVIMTMFRLILMHASLRPEPPLKQRFEFGS